MEKHFKDQEPYACIDTRMRGPWNARVASDESFVQFHTPAARDRVVKEILDKGHANNLKSSKGTSLKVNRMRSDFIRGRDFAMRKSEELIKGKLQTVGASGEVKYVKGKESRKITVNNHDAFVQALADPHGRFVGEFRDLALP